MSQVFVEGSLQFEFDSTWQVKRVEPHDSYTQKKQSSMESKPLSVDFVATHNVEGSVLVEVKDYRNRSKKRVTSGEIEREFARKVHDSIATVVGGGRMAGGTADPWRAAARVMADPVSRLWAVLVLEEEMVTHRVSGPHMKQMRGTMQKRLQSRLAWLTRRVRLMDCKTFEQVFTGCVISKAKAANNT